MSFSDDSDSAADCRSARVPRPSRSSLHSRLGQFATSLILLAGLLAAPAPVGGQVLPRKSENQILLEDYGLAHQKFAEEMEALAAECEAEGLKTEAAVIRERSARLDLLKLDVDKLPSEVGGTPFAPDDAWGPRRAELEKAYAARVYALSQKAMSQRNISLCFHLIREVAFHDPDHANARRMLGYMVYDGTWTTPFVANNLRRGLVWDSEFGWLPQAHVKRYQQGMRYVGGVWMPAAKEEGLRRDFNRSPWVVESEHFIVTTNHSLQRGVQLSTRLEGFHRYFVREFSAFFNTPQQMRTLFDGKALSSGSVKKHKVNYYASRGEFVAKLQSQPNITLCNGIYMPQQEIAHFFYDPNLDVTHEETLYHEVTHQLLSESGTKVVSVAADRDFWIVEGLACYMESFKQDEGEVTVGFPLHKRVIAACHHAETPGEFVPLQAFVSMGQHEFQNAGKLSVLQRYYAQATAESHFFLHYRDGLYRDAFIQYLSEIYSPNPNVRAKVTPLDRLTGISFATLDSQYREYLKEIAAAETASKPGPPAK